MSHDNATGAAFPSEPEDVDSGQLTGMVKVLFGDTADYVLGDVLSMAGYRRANAIRIIRVCLKLLGDGVADEASIPSRVAGMFLHSGSYCGEVVSSVYWGGILASSRTPHLRDDRALRWLGVVSRLSEYELRAHYLFYSTLRLLLMNYREPGHIDFGGDRFHLATFIPTYFFMTTMEFDEGEVARMPKIISSILYGIGQELLVDGSNSGADHYLREQFKTNVTNVIKGEGIVFTPSILGLRLFLWAFGYPDVDERFILDPRVFCSVPGILPGVPNAGLVYKP